MPAKVNDAKPKPFCYILMNSEGVLRYPKKHRAPVERCQQPGDELLELYLEPINHEDTTDGSNNP